MNIKRILISLSSVSLIGTSIGFGLNHIKEARNRAGGNGLIDSLGNKFDLTEPSHNAGDGKGMKGDSDGGEKQYSRDNNKSKKIREKYSTGQDARLAFLLKIEEFKKLPKEKSTHVFYSHYGNDEELTKFIKYPGTK